MYQDLILSLESSVDTDPIVLLTEGGISDELKSTLDDAKIPFIVNADSSLGKHIGIHKGRDINAVVDGVYIPELDTNAGIGRRVRVITSESMNVDIEADAYLVDDEDVAESLEAAGRVVLRNVDELKVFVKY